MLQTRTISLPVTLPKGVYQCERCLNRLRDSLLQIEGVSSVDFNPLESTMTLVYDSNLVPIEEIEKRASLTGVHLREHFDHRTLKLVGLDCPDCAVKLEKSVRRMDGVLWVGTNFASSRISVEYEPSKVGESAIARRVRDLGYGVRQADSEETTCRVRPHVEENEQPSLTTWLSTRQTVFMAIAGICMILGLTFACLRAPIPMRVFYGLSALTGGIYALRGAFSSLRTLVLDMNVLMCVASIGAIAIGDWFEAAAVMFLFSLGNALESRTVERARESVRSLVNLFPSEARVRRGEEEIVVPVCDVVVGDVFIVRPGEKIATDGVVIAGASSVNQASVTGESAPVEKTVGDKVFAGSMNQRGSIDVEATSASEDNTLARIIHLVEEAQSEKAPSQRLAEIFGRYYTPSVMGLALVVAAVAPLVFHLTIGSAVYTALTLLVVSCPCALVISTPVTIVSAIGNAAWHGVLVKGGSHLEAAGIVKVVAFDKTGTITTGESRVTDIVPFGEFSRDRLLSLAASVEGRSEHPLAEAVRREAKMRGIFVQDVTDFEALTGMGAAAKFDGDTCVIGNSRLMEQLGIGLEEHQSGIDSLQNEGKTVILVALNGRAAGIIALSDTVRESAKEAFAGLRRMGIERIVMITGDNEMTAGAVARDLEIDEYYAELLPQDKVDIVRVLTERFGSRVAFVGDGVNDAPALAAATVGIAMGAAGSPTALETADIALMSEDLKKLPYTIRLSRQALRTIRQNVVFSLGVIAVLITTTLAGILRLSLGVFGHEGSALLVIANGMRLLRFR